MATLRAPVCLAILVVGFAAGCGGAVDEEEVARIQEALAAPDGSETETDETSSFGDSAVARIDGFDTVDPSLVSMEPEAAQYVKDGALAFTSYHLAVLWGHLPFAHDKSEESGDPQRIDWTGSVDVDRGVVGVLKMLKFDKRDHLVRDGARNAVTFVSHTKPHVDGLYIRVLVPAGATPTLHFKTASLTTDIDLSALGGAKVGGSEPLGDGRNGVAWIGFQDRPGCDQGLMAGRWVKLRPHVGKFRGRVFDASGDTLGRVKGIWGRPKKSDDRLFFGKYISEDGTYRGLLGGTYGEGHADGIWGTKRERGELHVISTDGYAKGDGKGVWLGRWSEKCN